MIEHWKRIVYLISAIQVGAGITIIGVISFIPLFLGDIGVSDQGEAAFWAGLISGITPLMICFTAPYWTTKANQWGPRKPMMVLLAMLSLSVGLSSLATSPVQLFLLRMVQGFVGGFVPIGLAIITMIVPEKHLAWGMGLYQASMVMGVVFGPLIGGLAADLLGYRAPFLVFSALAFMCFLGVAFLMPNIQHKHKIDRGTSQLSLIKYFLSIPKVRLLVFMQFLCNFGITGIGPILPLYIKHYMDVDEAFVATIVGIVIFLAGLFSALASLSIGRLTKRMGMPQILVSATIGVGVFFIMQYLMPNIWGLGAFRALAGFAMGFIMPTANTLISQNVPVERRSIVFGVVSSVSILGNVAGPFCSGLIAKEFGYAAVFWSTAFAFFISAYMIHSRFSKSQDVTEF